MNPEEFRWPIRVYYEDTDAGGVVYHAGYLRFMERVRTEWLRARGFEQDELLRRDGVLFAVKSLQIDFRKPARFNDLLWATARLEEVKRVSITFSQEVRRQDSEGERLCTAEVRVACLNADAFRPAPIPDSLLQWITDTR